MRFKDGYWEIREGVRPLTLVDHFDSLVEKNKLTVYAAPKKLGGRGDRVGSPLITAEITSPLPDVIRVRMYHHKGEARKLPEFSVPPEQSDHIVITDDGERCSFSAGKLSFTVSKRGAWRGVFARDGRELTEIVGRLSGHYECAFPGRNIGGPGLSQFGEDDYVHKPQSYMAQYLKLSVGENVYGFGERFTNFVKNGQTVDTWNEDGGTATDQAYKAIPFYVTSRGYGVFVNNPGRVSFEAGSEVVTAVQFSVKGDVIDYYVIGGDDLHGVLRNYTAMTGRPALPPEWSFGLWLSTSFTTDYDEKTVNSFIDGMIERKLPLSVFHFDCFWMKGSQWVDFEWDKEMFPDPAGILSRIKAKGLKVCVWINPYVAQKSPLFDEGAAKGYLVKLSDGSVWQWDRWQAGMGLVDFTNPDAAKWYQAKLKTLLDMGVDCFKTDFGERIPTNVVWHDGSDPERMHNYYTYLYNKTVFGLLEEARGKNEAIVFARSATAGGQQFPVHWGGDCAASYESMAETLRGGLSLSLCGFGFWSHDISGFEQTATPDLFKRWAAFGLLSSHSRLHGNQSYRVPWNFDDEACDVTRFFTRLKCGLMPYLWQAAVQSRGEGIPMMRPMILEYNDDSPDAAACVAIDRQYFMGPSLLAAPVFCETGDVSYYLPRGRWTNIISNEVIESSGGWRKEKHGYMSLPLLAKGGSLIAFGAETGRPDYDYADGVTFHLFELDDGQTAAAAVSDPNGSEVMKAEVSRTGDTITAKVSGGAKKWKLLLRNIHAGKIDGGDAADTPQGILIEAAGNSVTVSR